MSDDNSMAAGGCERHGNADDTSLQIKFFVSQLVFFANTPLKHDISVHNLTIRELLLETNSTL
jgi:hypothetical protein